MGKIYNWFDDRLGIKKLVRAACDEKIRGGARWAYVLGSATLFVFLLQALTGMFMTMYYVPSSDHAHTSVAYIQKVVSEGSIVRGLHYYGASAFIILILAHLTQTFVFGAYKGKRELNWVVGGVLLLIGLGFGFTGYLLPWDQEAYFGTRVGTSIAGEIPIVGHLQQRVMLGGSEITSLTLSRFFMVHVFLLPLGLALLVLLHLYLFRKARPAGPYHTRDDSKVETFYPKQLLFDVVAVLVVFIVLFALARLRPAQLGPEADPTSDYLARPAWYFLPLFELLKYFPGKLSLIPTVVLPALIFGLIFILPFIDRSEQRHPAKRLVAMIVFGFTLLGAIGLGVVSRIQDRSNREFRAKLESQQQESESYLSAEFKPQENGRAIAVTPPETEPPPAGTDPSRELFLANCSSCHGTNGDGGPLGPSLMNLAKRRKMTTTSLANWVVGHNRELAPGSMPKFQQLTSDQLNQLAEWVLKLQKPGTESQPRPAREQIAEAGAAERPSTSPKPTSKPDPVAGGKAGDTPSPKPSTTPKPVQAAGKPPAAYTENCGMCHGDHGQGGIGPKLAGVTSKPGRSPSDIAKILSGSARQYGLKSPMPTGFSDLSEANRAAIIEWIKSLGSK